MIRQCVRTLALIAVMGVSLSSLGAKGGTIVSNLGNDAGTFSPLTITSETFWAQQFTIGALPVELSRITAQLGNLDTGRSDDFALFVSLVCTTSASDFPIDGTLVTGFSYTPSDIPADGFADVAFTPGSSVVLDPGQFYWFVITGGSSDGTGSVDWQFTDDPTTTGPGALSGVGRFDVGSGWVANDSGPFVIQVEGAVIPEPTSWLMGAMGLSAAFAASRLRRRAA